MTPPATTPTAVWDEAIDRRPLPPMMVGSGRLVIVGAHPDDETLGAGGLLHCARAAGAQVDLVVATDGEAAFGDPDPDLARTRQRELRAALTELGLGDTVVHRLGLPDSGLAGREDELTALLRPLLSDADLCLAPWVGDPHPDHAAVGRAVLAAAPARAHRWAYLIWTLPWRTPDEPGLHWDHAAVLDLDPAAAAAKQSAIGCFASQVAPTAAAPILAADVLAHFGSGRELFFRSSPTTSAPVARFADLYGDGVDPWETRTSWYEQRKRDVLLACLPQPHYRHAAEPACGLGLLTPELAARCDRVTASEPVAVAVDAARRSTAGLPGVEVLACTLDDPRALPVDADLVVLSEILYYLSPADVASTVDRLPAGADVVLVHWRGHPAEAPRDAAATHRQLTDDPRLAVVVEHIDEQFLLHVLRKR